MHSVCRLFQSWLVLCMRFPFRTAALHSRGESLNIRLFALAAVVMSAGLVACGGGGGPISTPPAPVSTATPSQTPTPPLPSSSFKYSGSLAQSDVYTYPVSSPFPSSTSSATVSQTVSIGSSPITVGGSAVASDVHSVENDVTALQTTTTTSDGWIGFPTETTPAALYEYALFTNDGGSPSASSVNTSFTSPQQVDVIPEAAATWTNSPTAIVTEKDADGTSDTRTIAANGTYVDAQTDPFNLNLVITTNADGSGSYTGTLLQAFGITGFFMSAPANGTINVTVHAPAPSPSPGQTPGPAVVTPIASPAAWFGTTFKPYNESDTETAGVTYPGLCAVPAKFGTSGNHIAQVIDTTDPVLGYTEHKTMDEYTGSAGPVCVVLSDTQKYYYDYLNDTSGAISSFANFVGGPTPLHTYALNETVSLQSASGGGQSVFGARIAAVRSHFESVLQRRREARITAWRNTMKHVLTSRFNGRIVK